MKNIAGRSPNSFIVKSKIEYSIPTKDDTFQSWINRNGGIYYTDRRSNGYSSKLWKSPFILDAGALNIYIAARFGGKYYSINNAKNNEKEALNLWKGILEAKAGKLQSFFDEHCGKGRIIVSKRTEETRILIPVSPSRFKMLDVNDKIN